MSQLPLYRNSLKNRKFGKEDPHNFHSEKATIARRQGASENENYEANPTQSKTDSSDCFGIITTIIPTYRRPERLRKAIQSVLQQSYPHFQIWVYDNASEDETAAVVAELAKNDPRVYYYCHPKNIQSAPNFEYGMLQVKTPFFSFLSDDDVLLPEFYQTAIEGFDKYPQAGFSAGAVIDKHEDGKFISISKTGAEIKELYCPPEGLFRMINDYINWSGILFRQEVIRSIGGLDKSVKPIDVDFVLKAAARFSYIVSQKPCAIFIHHPTSYSGNCGLKLVWPSWFKIIENLKQERALSQIDKEKVEVLMKNKMRNLLTSIAIQGFLQKKMDEMTSIANLLTTLPKGKVRGILIKNGAAFSRKNVLFQSVFRFFVTCSYKLFKYVKNYRIRKDSKFIAMS